MIGDQNSQSTGGGRREANGKLGLTGEVDPEVEGEKVEGPVVTDAGEGGQNVAKAAPGKQDGIDLVAPQALEVEMEETHGKGHQGQSGQWQQ